MTTHAPAVSLRHLLLAGTAVSVFALAPSTGFAGGRNVELAQMKTAQASPDDKKGDDKTAPKPAEQKPERPKSPAAAPKPADKPAEPPKATDKPAEKSAPAPAPKREPAPPPRAAAPSQPAPAAQKSEPAKPDAKSEQKAAPKDSTKDATKDATKDVPKTAPKAAESPAKQQPATTQAPSPAQPKATESKPADAKPADAKPAETQKDAATPADPAAVAPPTQARSSSEFIRKKGEKSSAGLDEVKRQRRETREGDRTVIREGDRTIVRDGKRSIIRHDEASRFAIDARGVHVDRKGGTTTTIVTRPNGVRIITTTDERGHLLRRVRQTADGKSIVIIDNTFAGAPRDYFVEVPPPRLRGPRDRYIVDAGRVKRDRIYEVFVAPPIAQIDRRYTLDQVRYSEPLRSYMPRVDLDINFATGSWQLSPDQVDALSIIAAGIQQTIMRNPREVFLIEGHTDAVGSDIDNLSLSDRRAEAVAVALTERFGVPPENLVTQGYGEEYLKVETDGPSEANRRVAVRRITPLIDQQTAGRR